MYRGIKWAEGKLWYVFIGVLFSYNMYSLSGKENIYEFSNEIFYVDTALEESHLLFKEIKRNCSKKNDNACLSKSKRVHVFSHAKPGMLFLEGRWIEKEEISEWLVKSGVLESNVREFVFYGCEFAKGNKGLEVIQYLEDEFQIEIFASKDITGGSHNWIMEYGQGHVFFESSEYPYTLQGCKQTEITPVSVQNIPGAPFFIDCNNQGNLNQLIDNNEDTFGNGCIDTDWRNDDNNKGNGLRFDLGEAYSGVSDFYLVNDVNVTGGRNDGIRNFEIKLYDPAGNVIGVETGFEASSQGTAKEVFKFSKSYECVLYFDLVIINTWTRRPLQIREVAIGGDRVGKAPKKTICSRGDLNINLQDNFDETGMSFRWVARDQPFVTGETLILTNSPIIGDELINRSSEKRTVIYDISPFYSDGCEGNPLTYTITVNPEPAGLETNKAICDGDRLSKDLNTTVDLTGVSFTWQASENSNVTGETVMTSTSTNITDVLVNTTDIAQEVVYTISPRSALGCLGESYRYVVTVNPQPVGTESTEVICSGDRLSKDLSRDVNTSGVSFTWEATENSNVTGETVSSTSTNEITDTLVNTSGVVQEVVYTIIPRIGSGCLGTPYRYVVTVNPEPVGTETTDVICSGDRLSKDLLRDVSLTGVSFTWEATENSNVTGETVRATSTNEITDTLINKSSTVQEVVYTITPRSALGCLGASYRYIVTVNPEPVGTETTEAICSGDRLSKDLTTTIDLAGTSFTWQAMENSEVIGETIIAMSTGNITDILSNKSGVVQEVVYTITPRSALGCLGESYRYVVMVNPEPVGVETSEVICSGDRLSKDLTRDVDVSGGDFTWEASENSNVEGETVIATGSNEIMDTLINKSGIVQEVVYTITIRSASGCLGESYRYVVTVNPEPVGVETTDVICSGDRLSKDLTRDVDLAGVSFTWEATENSNVTGATVIAASTNEITDTLVNKSGVVQEVVYTITPRSALGCLGASYRYIVTVNPEPVGVETTEAICSGDRLFKDLTSTIDLAGTSFTWEALENSDVIGETVVAMSAGNITDTLINKSGVVQEVIYTITPRSALGCLGESYRYVVTVNPEPVGIETTDVICSGERLSKDLTRDVDVSGVDFTWESSENNNVEGETVIATGSNEITDTLINKSGAVQEVVYTITARSASGCLGESYRYVVTVNPEPVGVETTDVVCSGDRVSKDLTRDIDLTGVSFTWEAAENSNVTGTTVIATSTNEITDTLVNKSGVVQEVVYTITPRSALGCLGASYRYIVTVNPEPVGVETTDVICSGDRLSKDLTTTVDISGTTFTWQAIENLNVVGETITATSTSEITDTLINKSSIVQEVVYTITPRSALGCLGASYRYVVTVNPEPVGIETTDVICSGDRLSKDLTRDVDVSGGSFTWQAIENTNVIGETTTTMSTTIIADTLVNTSGVVQEVVYTITPRSTLGCLGASYRYVVTVNPEPVGVETTDVICSGDRLSKDLSATVDLSGGSFTWEAAENSNVTGAMIIATSTSEITDTLVNKSSTVQEVVYTITPRSALGCLGVSYRYVITVNPEPVGVETTDIICSGDRLSKDLTTAVDLSGTSFTWQAIENTNVTGETTTTMSTTIIADTLVNTSGVVQEVVYTITPRSTLGCLGASYRYVVTVNPEPVGVETTDVICSGDRLSKDLTRDIDVSGGDFTWKALENSNVTGATIIATSTSEITDTLVNKSGTVQEVVYTITPRSALGCLGASYRYVVTVNPEPVGVETTDVICSGDRLSKDLTTTVDISGTTFTWQAIENSNVAGETITATSTSEITDALINKSSIVQEVVYTITPRSALGCLGASYRYVVTVNPEPVGRETTDVICSGDRLSKDLTRDIDVSGGSFIWEASENSNVEGETVIATGSNEITDTLINKSGVVQEVVYTITPRSALGCLGESYRYVVAVNPEPVGVETTDIICSGDRLSKDLSQTVDLTGVSFIWQAAENNNVEGESITINNTNEIKDALVNRSGVIQHVVYTVTPRSSSGCVGAPYSYTVTVKAEPVGVETTDIICSGDRLSKDLSQTVDLSGVSFIWQATENNNLEGESLTTNNSNEIKDTLVNRSGVIQHVVYTVTPSGSLGCVGAPYSYTVTVKPEPVGVDTSEAICSGDSLSKDLANDIDLSGASFTWEAEDNSNIEGITLGQTTTATITDTLINSSASIQEVVYRITPQSSEGCIGASFTYTVQVSPENYVTEVLNTTISNGENVNYDLLSDVLPENTEFSWIADSNDFVEGESTELIEGNIITDILTNTTTNNQTIRYVIYPKSNSNCQGTSYVLLVTIETECFTIYNEFSPDQDGQNDTFIITCIEDYPNNTLEVFNRWGNTVYKKQGYMNEWDGSSEGRSTIAAESGLPSGTYYYIIDLGNGDDAKVGWLYINRR
ncbi:PKD-like domain-containing protein [Tenacibaculum sp. MAR_2009_124]|uniref:PKD-like domain-containing protein n=1 Tax=Tenacibaculum sp. MAR_2009_124 TaxID=1250059 RepID=UPI0015A1D4B0|nr:PKD-like domain-containing protein [Tenacibaculum sp. MAR_2009_124]